MLKENRNKLLLLCVIVFGVYANTITNGFIWDDDDLIVNNTRIKNIANIHTLLIPKKEEPYRPLRLVSFAIDDLLFGLNPAWYHLENNILHIVNVILLYFILLFLFKNTELAFFSALIFGINPAWNEAVVWIKNRSDLLCCLFFLSAFYMFIKRKYFLSNLIFLLALLTKEVAVAYPFIISAYIYIFEDKKDLKKTLPFWLLAISWGVLLFVLYEGGGVDRLSPGASIFFSFKLIFKFFVILFFPFILNAERFVSLPESVFDLEVILSFIALLGALYFLFRTKKRKTLAFPLFWVLINILPTANPAVVAGRALAEHRLYIPGIGFSILVYILLQNHKSLLYSLLPIYIFTTFNRNFDWKDGYTFWNKTVQTAPYSARAWTSLAISEKVRGNISVSEEKFRKAIELTENNDTPVNGLIDLLVETDRFEEAEGIAKDFIERNPDLLDVYRKLFDIYVYRKKYDLAKTLYNKAISVLELGALPAKDYIYWGIYSYQMGFSDRAEQYFLKAFELEPWNVTAINNLGSIYYGMGELEKSEKYYLKALRYVPENADIHYNLANIYDGLSNLDKTVEHLYSAVELNPAHSDSWYNLGVVMAKSKRFSEASRAFKKVMELEPYNEEVKRRYNELLSKF